MFWGLNLKPNRKYTQTTTKSFHISQAALDIESAQDDTNKIYIGSENQKFLICTLRKGKCEQVMLDLNFMEGDTICFQSVGSGNVSLAGYLIESTESDDDDDPDFQINDLREKLTKSGKKLKAIDALANADSDEEESDDDEDDADEDADSDGLGEEGESEEEDDDEEDDEEDDDDDDDEEDEEDESEADEDIEEEPKAKQPKLDKKAEKKPQQNGIAGKATKHEKKEKVKPKQQQPQQKQKETGSERSLAGGVKIQDIRVGNGAEAVRGKRANVLYEGRLKSDNRIFDSNKSGAGFKFGIGRGEVIKGWDVGVVGMKVGGKRRITCPPHMAYGARGHPPTIPPNSTLVFEVELKGVN